mmetsp:Transcript_18230/g.41265  ORF Transcript_18230/g.41265 Transcript_18230/m.41265 type:complete len:680 (-) Transcript_18230:48-2087(-)
MNWSCGRVAPPVYSTKASRSQPPNLHFGSPHRPYESNAQRDHAENCWSPDERGVDNEQAEYDEEVERCQPSHFQDELERTSRESGYQGMGSCTYYEREFIEPRSPYDDRDRREHREYNCDSGYDQHYCPPVGEVQFSRYDGRDDQQALESLEPHTRMYSNSMTYAQEYHEGGDEERNLYDDGHLDNRSGNEELPNGDEREQDSARHSCASDSLDCSDRYHGRHDQGEQMCDTRSYRDDRSLSCSRQCESDCGHGADEYSSREGDQESHKSALRHSQLDQCNLSSESLEVIHRIESVMESLINYLDRKEEPVLKGYRKKPDFYEDDSSEDDGSAADQFARPTSLNPSGDAKFSRSFGNIAQSRSFTSICLVMSFVHQLLLSNRTTTTREVYYVFVTHFRSQRECDGAILDVAKMLGVSRVSLGLSASPKGWFCGSLEITRRGTLPCGKDVSGKIDGTALPSVQGLPITKEWTERDDEGRTEDGVEILLSSKDARLIVVIEKEGVYNRLSEERIFDRFPCILVTGKGFPDLATRALVHALHHELELPVVGICDCNPFGVSVLALYCYAGERMGIDGRMRYSVPIEWIGLRPSDVDGLKSELPGTVFQRLTDLDRKRITSLLDTENNSNNPFLTEEDGEEIELMKERGYKLELEALYWLGCDFMAKWAIALLEKAYENNNNM